MLKLIIAQQQELIRLGLSHCFLSKQYEIENKISDFESLNAYLLKDKAQVLILDGDLIISDINSYILKLNQISPNTKIIITTDEETYFNFYKLIDNNAVSAICLKTDPCKEFNLAVDHSLNNNSYISESLKEKISEHNSKLTPKELQVIELLVLGLSNKEVATSLNNSERTINVHRSNIMQKLHLTNVVELINFSYSYGMSRLNLNQN